MKVIIILLLKRSYRGKSREEKAFCTDVYLESDCNSRYFLNCIGYDRENGLGSRYSKYRDINENLKLFYNMKDGQYKDGEKVLRAKIDMLSPNMNMRDPVLYRILHASHHRTKNKWCIYPMYDWAHGLEDSIEKITHSICTLEFEDHRPLYDWFLDQLNIYHPQQIEFSRLNLEYTIMSKRHLKSLVDNNHVGFPFRD